MEKLTFVSGATAEELKERAATLLDDAAKQDGQLKDFHLVAGAGTFMLACWLQYAPPAKTSAPAAPAPKK